MAQECNWEFDSVDPSDAAQSRESVDVASIMAVSLTIPTSCAGVPSEVLNPRTTWASGAAYDEQAMKLARMFVENFKTFEPGVTAEVLAAGPNA